jgi:Flp pilus assembly protein TadG
MLTERPHRTTPARCQVLPRLPDPRRWRRTKRRGAVLVLFALFLVVLIGMVGLVVDGAILTANHRQAQNAADAAALAAALDRMRGRTMQDATTTATTFVQTYNGLSNAPAPVVSSPPSTGAYAGRSDYVEVVVTVPVQTYLVHIVGVNQNRQVRARAVAGYEAHSTGEGVIVLNPDARPGLDVGGGGTIRVNGRIVVNSEGGGVDETNQPINNGNNGFAARGGQPNSDTGLFATDIDVVGGVDNPSTFKPILAGDPSPLHTRQLPEPDPLIQLPTPVVANGVDPTVRGSVSVTNQNVQGVPATSPGPGGLNFVAQGGEAVPGSVNPAVAGQVILHPGVYQSLSITGGNVYLVPGIYVLSPQQNVSNTLKITDGTVTAERIMFYNTAMSYNPNTGIPDINDGENTNPLPNAEYAGGIQINAGMKFSPIDTTSVNYQSLYPNAPPVSTVFDGMLFFQRRRHQAAVEISGNAASGLLAGTLYAKWSNFQISGQGTYDAQFIAGSVSVTGQGNVTILGAGEKRGKANKIYLVE